MPALALLSAVFVVALEQVVAWKYGVVGILGLLLLSIGLKAKGDLDLLESLGVPSRTLGTARRIAGRRHGHRVEEWSAVLAGSPEDGTRLSPAWQLYYALGFVCFALRLRLADLFGGLWTPVDWLISNRRRSNAFIAGGVTLQAILITTHDGLYTLCTEGLGWCAGGGIALRLLIGWLRRVRGIELAAVDRPPNQDDL